MATPPSRFVIVPDRPRSRWRPLLLGLAWLLSLLLAAYASYRYAVPQLSRVTGELNASEQELHALRAEREQLLQDKTVLARADQVSRDAMTQLQGMLSEREEEIAALRADVVFYERLVGGNAQRKGLSVHSVEFRPREDGDLSFVVTLTQNLKKPGMTRGELSFALEGSRSGNLETLDWKTLRQQDDNQPMSFEFRYFQKVEGSVMLPSGFTPHRVKLRVVRDGDAIESTVPWEDTQKAEGG